MYHLKMAKQLGETQLRKKIENVEKKLSKLQQSNEKLKKTN